MDKMLFFGKEMGMKKAVHIMLFLALAFVTRAELVDDFESYAAGPVSTVVTDGSWLTDTTDPDAVIEADPADSSNKVMSTVEAGGTGGAGQTGSYAVLDSAASIPDGSTKTLFLRFRINTLTTDQAIGFTSIDAPTLHGAGDWNEFHACFRLTAGAIDVRDGGSWLTNLTNRTLTVDTWYNLWFVVNNADGTGSDTVQLYMNTTSADATEADCLLSGAKDTFAFRVQDADTLDRIYWRAQDGSEAVDKVFIDDVHVSPGKDLSFPSSRNPYNPVVEQTVNGSVINTTLRWKAGMDPDGNYEVNPNIVDQYLFMSSGKLTDPNLFYVDTAGAPLSLSDPNSEYSLVQVYDKTYYWAVVEAIDGYAHDGILRSALTPNVSTIDDVDPNNIIGSTWMYESVKSIPIVAAGGQPVESRVFPFETAAFTCAFSSVSAPTVTWYKYVDGVNDTKLTAGGDVAIALDDSAAPNYTATLDIATPVEGVDNDEGQYYCVLTVGEGESQQSVQSNSANLVVKRKLAEYLFEENLADTSGYGNNGQGKDVAGLAEPNSLLASNVTLPYVEGIGGSGTHGVSLTTTQYVDFGTEAYPRAGDIGNGFGEGMDRGTILCWVKPIQAGTILLDYNNGSTTGFGLSVNTSPNARMDIRGEGPAQEYQSLGTSEGRPPMTSWTFFDGAWHMVAVTWTAGDSVTVYVDGEWVSSAAGGSPYQYLPWQRGVLMGTSRTSGNRDILASFLGGAFDNLRVYNYRFTQDEIAQEYLDTTGKYPCVNHTFIGNEYNFDNGPSSYCKIDLADFAVFVQNWLADGLFVEP